MNEGPIPALVPRPKIDALAAILPQGLRDRVAAILSDNDLATLTYLAQQGMGPNTLRALASDLNYLETWSRAALGIPLPWPAPEAVVLKFIAHHLYDAAERERDSGHGMPGEVSASLRAQKCLRTEGPHAAGTVHRRLALWSTLHRWHGVDGPFSSPNLRNAMRLAVRAADRPRHRKSANAVTRDILDQLIATCDGQRLVDIRDRALLLTAFGSGGRRRSEIAKLRVEDLIDRPPVPDRSDDPAEMLPVLAMRLGRTKTASTDQDEHVLLTGRPVRELKAWLMISLIKNGPVFRAIDRWGHLGAKALDGQSVNAIIKARCRQAGLSPAAYSAHGLRSGYLTEAARRGVPMQEAMRQSRHRSVQQAADYYNEVEIVRGDSARLA